MKAKNIVSVIFWLFVSKIFVPLMAILFIYPYVLIIDILDFLIFDIKFIETHKQTITKLKEAVLK
jgi:hypothetical protein